MKVSVFQQAMAVGLAAVVCVVSMAGLAAGLGVMARVAVVAFQCGWQWMGRYVGA
jgi:hypothetical protein